MTFLFATGIENSNPTIKNGSVRHDQLESCGFYERWQTDFELVRETGVDALRYGPPLHTTWRAPGLCDWSFADETLKALRGKVEVIADLCHFGVPDWVGSFQNPDFPLLFAHYAQCFAQRYPWIRYYTPVNEPLITCLFSDLFGWWNSQGTTDKSFVRAIANVVKANAMAMQAILTVRPDARFIMAEAHEFTHAECDKGERDAAIKNERRFITFDLCLSHPVSQRMREYLLDNGMSEAEHRWFMDDKGLKPHCVIGADYYVTSEGMIHSNGETSFAEDVCGYHELSRQYHDRYKLPLMLSETNMAQGERGDEAVRWLRQQWRQLCFSKKHHGVPQVGFCWYSLTDQTDWDCALREKRGTVNPLGLYDLDRNIRPVGRAFKELISQGRACSIA